MRKAALVQLPKGIFNVKGRKGQTYWYFQRDRGKPTKGPLVRLPGSPTDADFWTAYRAAAGDSGVAPGSVADLVTKWKETPRWIKLRPNSKEIYTTVAARVIEVWGALRPDQITPAAIAAWRDTFVDRPSAGNLHLSVAREFFRFCAERGLCPHNPAREVRRLEVDLDAGARPIPEDIYQRVIKTAPEPVRRLFILGRATGQRISDLVEMRPLDRDGAGIRLTITKRRKSRDHWVPLTQEFIALIDGWECPPMATYFNNAGRKRSDQSMRRDWNLWRRKKGNEWIGDITPHDLRATAVCDDRLAGFSHQQIAARRGMSLQMVMHYSRHIDQRLAAGYQNEAETIGQSESKQPAKR